MISKNFFIWLFISMPLFHVSVSALSYINYLHSSSCNTANMTSSNNITCIDDPISQYGKVLLLKTTNYLTKNITCTAICKVFLRAMSKSNQTIWVAAYRNNKNDIGTKVKITSNAKWDVYSVSFPNPNGISGASFPLAILIADINVVSDVMVADFISTDEVGLNLDEQTLFFSYTNLWNRYKFLQTVNVANYDLSYNGVSLQIAGNLAPNAITTCYALPIEGGQNQRRSFQLTGSNSFTLNISQINIPHYKVKITMDVFVIDQWSNENIYIVVDGRICSMSQYSSSVFDQNAPCGNSKKAIVNTETIEFDFPSNRNSIVVQLYTDSLKNDDVASYGFRNIVVDILECSTLCKNCNGPTIDNCTDCIDNSFKLFGVCQCLIQYQQTGDFQCSTVPNTLDYCPILNTNFWIMTVVNYNCSYSSSSESHQLNLRYLPYYQHFTDCLNFTIYPLSNINAKLQPTITQDFISNYMSFTFTTATMKNVYLCSYQETTDTLYYSCNFTIESYYQGLFLIYSYFVYEFQMNKITQNSLSFIAAPVLIKVSDCCCGNAQNIGYCKDNSVIQSKAYLCTNNTCKSYYDNTTTTFNYTQTIYITHLILNQSIVNLYTLNVSSLVLVCSYGKFKFIG